MLDALKLKNKIFNTDYFFSYIKNKPGLKFLNLEKQVLY